jgi:hypothetical protein
MIAFCKQSYQRGDGRIAEKIMANAKRDDKKSDPIPQNNHNEQSEVR